MRGFADKVIWITGASSGIGAALARAFGASGARLILSGRREDALAEIAKEAGDRGAASTATIAFEATHFDRLPELTADAEGRHGRIDMLVNNAGISQRSRALETDMAVYRKLFEIDFFAPVALTKLVLPGMVERKSGHIVVTSSVAGKVGGPQRTGYCAAKHALQGYYDALRAEIWEHNIKVSLITPGFIRTDISTNALKGDGTTFGTTDKNIAGGMDPDAAARVILRGLRRGHDEIAVGAGPEMHALWLKRVAPGMLNRVARKLG